MIKNFEVTIKKRKVIVIRPDLTALETQMDNYTFMKHLLERTIFISVSLQNESLSDDKRNEYLEIREKLRKDYEFTQMYEVRRANQNGEKFEILMDEVHGAHKNTMKAIHLYLKAGKPYLQNTSNTKEEIFLKEITEIRKILRKSDTTTEERKYFLKRENLLEKEIDWEGEMKKLLGDFPFDKNLNEVRKRRYGI
ncbi:MAG: hypothetical protein ACTSP8_11935 [Promethearchaeota archaeon]